jgi:DNA invertase Pin-like site-specific DNA recombinase
VSAAHAARRGWVLVASFKDDGFSGFKEVTRGGFTGLITAIERGDVDVVIVRDVDRVDPEPDRLEPVREGVHSAWR